MCVSTGIVYDGGTQTQVMKHKLNLVDSRHSALVYTYNDGGGPQVQLAITVLAGTMCTEKFSLLCVHTYIREHSSVRLTTVQRCFFEVSKFYEFRQNTK